MFYVLFNSIYHSLRLQVLCCAISSDNEIVVSGSQDGSIRLWRLHNGDSICAYNTGADVFKVKISKNSRTVVALGDKMQARKLIMLQIVRRKTRSQFPSRATSPYPSDASRPISPYREGGCSGPSPYRHQSSSSYVSEHNIAGSPGYRK